LYGKLFVEVFGCWEEHHIPDKVWLFVTDDNTDIVGFASGFQTKNKEIYLQWGGCCPKYRGPRVKKWLREVRDYLHETYDFIITTVGAENTAMLRLYLGIGYFIYGTKHSTDHKTYVELISTKEK